VTLYEATDRGHYRGPPREEQQVIPSVGPPLELPPEDPLHGTPSGGLASGHTSVWDHLLGTSSRPHLRDTFRRPSLGDTTGDPLGRTNRLSLPRDPSWKFPWGTSLKETTSWGLSLGDHIYGIPYRGLLLVVSCTGPVRGTPSGELPPRDPFGDPLWSTHSEGTLWVNPSRSLGNHPVHGLG
jgi:hypothetical protein